MANLRATGESKDRRENNSPPRKISTQTMNEIKKKIKNKNGKDIRSLARSVGVHPYTLRRNLRERCGVTFVKKEVVPKYTLQEEKIAKTTTRRMYDKHIAPVDEIIMDDEMYIDENGTVTHGADGFYTDNKQLAPDRVRFVGKKKFPAKVGIWFAVGSKGMSTFYMWRAGSAINQDIYLKECLQKRLMRWINLYYKNTSYIFWPDKASSHYAKKVVAFLESRRVPMVPKSDNPTNLPQARPIELINSIIKSRVFADGFKCRNIEQLETRVRDVVTRLRTKDKDVTIRTMAKTRTLIRKVARGGVYAHKK